MIRNPSGVRATERGRPGLETASRQALAASFSFFIGRTLTFTVAGLALKVVGFTRERD